MGVSNAEGPNSNLMRTVGPDGCAPGVSRYMLYTSGWECATSRLWGPCAYHVALGPSGSHSRALRRGPFRQGPLAKGVPVSLLAPCSAGHCSCLFCLRLLSFTTSWATESPAVLLQA